MKLNKQFLKKQLALLMTFTLLLGANFTVMAQKDERSENHKMQDRSGMDDKKLKEMQSKNEAYLIDIYKIVDAYPDFSYEYLYNNGELQKVVITGIEDPDDQQRVAMLIYNVRSNNDIMKNYSDTHGIYYAPEKNAEPKIGYENFRDEVRDNLDYPESAKNNKVEGTVYVKFVVNENGEVRNAIATPAIDSNKDSQVEKLEEEALAAVEEVEAQWTPATVDGDQVSSWVVLPVTFNYEEVPSIPTKLIR